jgi:hypothetical protein
MLKTDFIGDQLQEKFHRWLSPPDPWVIHNMIRNVHHRGTATWFTQGDDFSNWKSDGSLLWIHGLRPYIPSVPFAHC